MFVPNILFFVDADKANSRVCLSKMFRIFLVLILVLFFIEITKTLKKSWASVPHHIEDISRRHSWLAFVLNLVY